MKDTPDGIVIKKTGMPRYCVRKKNSCGNFYYYFQKNECRIRLPDISADDFWESYIAALEGMNGATGLSESDLVRNTTMTKNELDRYFHSLERGAKQRAKSAGREYTLPKFWGADKYVEQNGLCALSGIEMRKGQGRMDPYSPSIDRIDSSKGYTPENCQLVLHRVNIAKGDMNEDDFIKLCRSVLSFRRKTERERM